MTTNWACSLGYPARVQKTAGVGLEWGGGLGAGTAPRRQRGASGSKPSPPGARSPFLPGSQSPPDCQLFQTNERCLYLSSCIESQESYCENASVSHLLGTQGLQTERETERNHLFSLPKDTQVYFSEIVYRFHDMVNPCTCSPILAPKEPYSFHHQVRDKLHIKCNLK